MLFLLTAPLQSAMLRGSIGVVVLFLLVLFAIYQTKHTSVAVWISIALIVCTIGFTTVFFIVLRHQDGPHLWVHDSTLQTEEAMRALLDGRNPYAVDFRSTPLVDWLWQPDGHDNPALDHYVYFPGMFIVGLPFFAAVDAVNGWYDQRILHLILLGVLIWSLVRLYNSRRQWVPLVLTVAFLQPLFFYYFIIGHNDIVMYAVLAASALALHRKRKITAAILLGIGCAVKQSVLPFTLFFIWYQLIEDGFRFSRQDIKNALGWVWPIIVIPAVCILSFMLWGFGDFWQDTFEFFSSASTLSPINGIGITGLLYRLGVVPTIWSPLDVRIPQILSVLAVVGVCLVWMKKRNSLFRALICGTLCLATVWFFARSFNLSHLGVIIEGLVMSGILFYVSRHSPADQNISKGTAGPISR